MYSNSQIRYQTKPNFKKRWLPLKKSKESKKRQTKPWQECSRQQKYNRKKTFAHDVEEAFELL